MDHLVKFQTAEGREGQHTAASLDDAVRFVERLRNNEDATEVRVFRMHEVPIEFKTYFKVELGGAAAEEPKTESHAPVEDSGTGGSHTPLVATPSSQSADGDADSNGKRLFSRA